MTDPTAGYHPRATVLVRLFRPALRRPSLIGVVAGLIAGSGLDILLPAGTPWPLRALAGVAAFAAGGLLLALLRWTAGHRPPAAARRGRMVGPREGAIAP